MPSFLSGRHSSRSQQQQQQQQQHDQEQQQQLQLQPPQQPQQHGFLDSADVGSGPGTASASSFANTDSASFDSLLSKQPPPATQRLQQVQQLLQQQQQQQQQQTRPSSFIGSANSLGKNSSTKTPAGTASSGASVRGSVGEPPAFDAHQASPAVFGPPPNHEYIDAVTRSQSQRYSTQTSSLAGHQHYSSASVGAVSADDLNALQGQAHDLFVQQQARGQVSPQPARAPAPASAPAPEARRTTRKLFKNFLSGGSASKHADSRAQQAPSPPPSASLNAHSSLAGLSRRPSKRLSSQQQPPPPLRTGLSQVSVLDPQDEWSALQQQQQLYGPAGAGTSTQPSPLQGTGDFSHYSIAESNDERLLSDPPPSIRRVGTGDLGQRDQRDRNPFHPEDTRLPPGFVHEHRGPSQQDTVYGQNQSDHGQQQQYPAGHFQEFQEPANGPHHHQFTGLLHSTSLQHEYSSHQPKPAQHQHQHQGPDTIAQLSRESLVADGELAAPAVASLQQQNAQDLAPTPPPLASQQQQPQPPQPHAGQQQGGPGHGGQHGQPVSAKLGLQLQHHLAQTAVQQQQQQQQQQEMGPPSGRRSQDVNERTASIRISPSAGEPSAGAPPAYRHSQAANPLPGPPAGPGAASQSDARPYDAAMGETRNTTPQPPGERDVANSEADKSMKELVTKYKYVKRLYFEGQSQIEHLQNAIANQRMSQSRTCLDDNGYIALFGRLNGAITNLSFNLRRNWISLPSWVEPYASAEALKTGRQEMTAIGRAVITKWLVETVFNRCFHPNLDPVLSEHLKQIERNIRRTSYKMSSQEEFGAQMDKVISWRMMTLDGLQSLIQGHEISPQGQKFTQNATAAMVKYLGQHMSDMPAQEIAGGASSIIDLAVNIAINIPMESRDVAISFPSPLDSIVPHLMDVEKGGLPPLDTRGPDDGGNHDENMGDEDDDRMRSAHPSNDMPKVRFAGFVAVEVSGRQVLMKAPVWTL